MSVDYRETLVTYLNSETKQQCAENLGISVSNLSVRLHKMKKAGVQIPPPSI